MVRSKKKLKISEFHDEETKNLVLFFSAIQDP